jgi:2-oxoglutarate dehydrogenase E2 component (dihydrolipoamide succinyltransferase)
MSRLRQVVAQRMTDSLQVSAQLTTVQRVDITRIAAPGPREDRYQARQNIKLTYLPFYAKATVEALRAVPQLNASINAESKEVTYDGHVHLAIALDGPQGLLVPVIKNGEIWTSPVWPVESPTWPARARTSKIGPDELSGGMFTITHVGAVGSLSGYPDHQPAAGGDTRHGCNRRGRQRSPRSFAICAAGGPREPKVGN